MPGTSEVSLSIWLLLFGGGDVTDGIYSRRDLIFSGPTRFRYCSLVLQYMLLEGFNWVFISGRKVQHHTTVGFYLSLDW